MEQEEKNVLSNGLKSLGLYSENSLVLLEKYFDQITLFNKSLGLVNAEGKDLVVKHILDSVSAAGIIEKEVNSGCEIADLGSGNGMPGLALSCVLPSYRFALVDRMGRRTGFLRNTVVLLGLTDRVRVVEKDLKLLNEKFDSVVFRAFRPMSEICSDVERILNSNGKVFIYKASEDNIQEEISSSQGVFSSSVEELSVPYLDAERKLLVLKKTF